MEFVDHDRLLRLQRAAKKGDIIHTRQGVFESSPCSVCGFHHKLALSLKKQAPCPATEIGMQYYAKHPKEKQQIENFPLNQVLKATIQTLPSSEKPTTKQKNLSSRSVPKVVKSEEVEGHPHEGQALRPKTSRGKKKKRGLSVDRAKDQSSILDALTWNDVFPEPQLSGSEASSDADSSRDQQDVEAMRRKLVREMFTQEEEALRYRLAKEKEKYYLDTRYGIYSLWKQILCFQGFAVQGKRKGTCRSQI